MFGTILLVLSILLTLSAGIMLEPEKPWTSDILDQSKYSDAIKALMSKYPNGNTPVFSFPPTKAPISDITSISFYATGPQDESGNGDQGCHGGGAQGDIVIPRADFEYPKLCPSGPGGDGNNDDLEGNGASFSIAGNLGKCQLNFYTQVGCNDKDWAGYMHGASQRKCNAPRDSKGSLLKGLRSFNYVCPDA